MSVLLLMQATGRVTERELAERLEVSQRTIHRDLEALSAARIPVVALRGSQGGWELAKGWRTQVPGLDEAELRALLMAQPRAIGHPRLAAAAESALNKLMAALPAPMKEQAAIMRERLHIDASSWRETGEDLSMLGLVQDAVARAKKLAFDYRRADGERGPRTVDPLGLVAKGASWYLVAGTANGMRTFKVSRMEKVTVLAGGFERPAKFDLAAHWKQSTAELGRQRRSYPVILAVAIETARKVTAMGMARLVEDAGSSADLPEGWVTVKAEFDGLDEAGFVVLGLGSRARVLAPVELRRRVLAEAAMVAAQEPVALNPR